MIKEVKKVAQAKKTNKNVSPIMKIINSPISIIVALIILCIGLLIYTRYLVGCNKVYTFYGYTDEFSFFGGTIYEGQTMNYFGDSKVLYTGKDINLSDYELGFYIKDGDNYNAISVMKGYETTSESEVAYASLKDILMGSGLSFTETHKEAQFLSKENMKNIDKLVFRVAGKDKSGKDVDIEVPMTVEKITK